MPEPTVETTPTPPAVAPKRRNPILVVAILAAAIGGGITLWEYVLEDRLVPRRWGEVAPGAIYRSGQLHPALVERTLRGHDIEVVISLDGDDTPALAAEAAATKRLGIERFVFPLRGDGTGDVANYARAIAAMDAAERAGQPVLVHCAAGSQRTGGVVACYRMLVEGVPGSVAYQDLEVYDWHPEKNQILLEYVNGNMPEIVRRLVEMGVIDEAPDPLPVLAP